MVLSGIENLWSIDSHEQEGILELKQLFLKHIEILKRSITRSHSCEKWYNDIVSYCEFDLFLNVCLSYVCSYRFAMTSIYC